MLSHISLDTLLHGPGRDCDDSTGLLIQEVFLGGFSRDGVANPAVDSVHLINE